MILAPGAPKSMILGTEEHSQSQHVPVVCWRFVFDEEKEEQEKEEEVEEEEGEEEEE